MAFWEPWALQRMYELQPQLRQQVTGMKAGTPKIYGLWFRLAPFRGFLDKLDPE